MSQVLLIEPDKPLSKVYATVLKKAGHKVAVASNSQEAINKADAQTPDVVILEIQLIGHSGIEFLYEFRSYADWQNIPVIINSSVPYTELEDSWELLNNHLGVSEYSYKSQTDLNSLVNSVNLILQPQ